MSGEEMSDTNEATKVELRRYIVTGIREVRFEVEVEARSPQHAMKLVNNGEAHVGLSDYCENETTYAEGAEIND
jgi:hypothetical protein